MYGTFFLILLVVFIGLDVVLHLFCPFMTTGPHAGKLRATCYILLLALLFAALRGTDEGTLPIRVYPDGMAGFFTRYIIWCQSPMDLAAAFGIAVGALLLTVAVSILVAYVQYCGGTFTLIHAAYIKSLWFSTLVAAVTCFCYPVISLVIWGALHLMRPLFFRRDENFCRKVLLLSKQEHRRKRRRASARKIDSALPPTLTFRDIPRHYRETVADFNKNVQPKRPFRQMAAPYSVVLGGIALWTLCWIYSVSQGAYGESEAFFVVQAVVGISGALLTYEAILWRITEK